MLPSMLPRPFFNPSSDYLKQLSKKTMAIGVAGYVQHDTQRPSNCHNYATIHEAPKDVKKYVVNAKTVVSKKVK